MATKPKPTPETKTYWLNDDQIIALVKQSKSKGMTLDEACAKLESINYVINGHQVYLSAFVSEFHNFETNKAIKSVF